MTETQRHTAYPGCYALSKVLEEVMLEQYVIQLSFGPDVFGGPRWCDMVGPERAAQYQASGAVPVMRDAQGVAVKRNFVHVDDLVSAILLALDNPRVRGQTMNVCMDEPVDYVELGTYLASIRGLPLVNVATPYHSTWLDNAKAKFLLGWRAHYDMRRMADAAFSYQRAADDPRVVWYPG